MNFYLPEVSFLDYIINAHSISSDAEKINSIKVCTKPTYYNKYQQFLGLIDWYRRFIEDFSRIIASLQIFVNQKTVEWSTT